MFSRQTGSMNNASNGNLIEFRAGRMNMVGKMVHPDTRKGLVYLTQSDDGLMHFCWKDRISGKVEDDLIVFPDDFEFKRVDQCKTGRVYVLKFKTSSRRMFFWMQEPKPDKDEDFCRRVNELMNNPPASHQRGGSDNNDLQYMLNNMSQQQLMQLFGGVGQMGGLSSLLGSMNRTSETNRTPLSARTTPSVSTGGTTPALQTPDNVTLPRNPSAPKPKGNKTNSTSTPPISKDNGSGRSSYEVGKTSPNPPNSSAPYANPFQAYLSNLSPEHGAGRSLNIDLSSAITRSEAISQLIKDPECVNTLYVHLPESTENSDEDRKQQIKDHINSPQFQQALSQFSNALQSAQLGPVVSQFELSPEAIAAAYSGNLEEFVHALEKALPEGTKVGKIIDSTKTSATAFKNDEEPSKEKKGANEKNEDKK